MEKKKRKRKASVRQIKALQLMNSLGYSKHKAMIEAGYSQVTASKPNRKFFQTKGVQSQIMDMGKYLEEAGLNSRYMVLKFKEWMGAQRQISAIVIGDPKDADSKTTDFIEVPDYKTQLEAYKEWKKVMDQAQNPDTTGKKVGRKLTIEEFVED
jgi:hypothetical protein